MTPTPDLIKELIQSHNGHSDEGESTFSESAKRLQEFISIELNLYKRIAELELEKSNLEKRVKTLQNQIIIDQQTILKSTL